MAQKRALPSSWKLFTAASFGLGVLGLLLFLVLRPTDDRSRVAAICRRREKKTAVSLSFSGSSVFVPGFGSGRPPCRVYLFERTRKDQTGDCTLLQLGSQGLGLCHLRACRCFMSTGFGAFSRGFGFRLRFVVRFLSRVGRPDGSRVQAKERTKRNCFLRKVRWMPWLLPGQ